MPIDVDYLPLRSTALTGALLGALTGCWPMLALAMAPPASRVVLAVHGGTGMAQADLTGDLEKQLRAALAAALDAGYRVLCEPSGTSVDAVEAAITVLEDSPLFNAGRGSVFTAEGRNELDASIMAGQGRKAGAVAGVTNVKNPIRAARAVMDSSSHVLLIGQGAESFAAEAGLEIVSPDYFWTESRWRQLQNFLRKQGTEPELPGSTREWGTVGAVALDRSGNLAAGTSTGGMTGKRPGRLGDTPIIGAGTYADNDACAVSATGHGEYFIRYAVAHEIVARMKYNHQSLEAAAADVVLTELQTAGGEGGVIALDGKGNFAAPFNSAGLYRGWIDQDDKQTIALYRG
ncbi:MAG TPA: isoaspartyl peptidase/L-asparaginase [Pirellulales bacterium]|nr:isoaspartyl peptidase/L-asparaginase [Pirellulales bacterium]